MENKAELEKQLDAIWKIKCAFKWGKFCEGCGEPASVVHHFIPKSRNGLMRYDIQNGVPLCVNCHYKVHFSPSPPEIHRIVDKIRKNRGEKWCKYIDEKEKVHGRSFKNISWLKSQKEKLLKYE